MKSSVFDFDSIQYEGTDIFGLTDLRNRLDFGPNLKNQSKNRLFCPRANSIKIKSCIRNNIKINLCEILDLASSLKMHRIVVQFILSNVNCQKKCEIFFSNFVAIS